MEKPSQNVQEIAQKIGYYFLGFFENDYEKTADYLKKLQITNIQETKAEIVIKTARPGYMIGRRGIHIDGIAKLFPQKIKIVESFSWCDYMTPYHPDNMIDWERGENYIFETE